jgi:lysine 2,3-aminomutase
LRQLQVQDGAEAEPGLWTAVPRDVTAAPVEAEPAASLNPGAYPRSSLAPVSYRDYYYPHVRDEEWNDWRWQFRNRVTTLEQWDRFFPIPAPDRDAVRQVMREFRLGLTPYYLSLIDPRDPADPMRLQSAPSTQEFVSLFSGSEDPLGEQTTSPVPGIIHRYPDRCLLIATNSCAMYCRYCTRKRLMHEGDAPPDREALKRMVEYIARTPAIRDVIVSGGDPLTWSTGRIEELLCDLRSIPHVEIIRFGSRVPVTLPQRITPELCAMLERFGPIWINVHFNHPREVTTDAGRACGLLLRHGIPLNNQTVLLRGVNDDPVTMKSLVHALMRIKVRPYYIYQCDQVAGAEHFRTTVAKGLEIIGHLRGHTSGLAVPAFVVDAPGGGGKVALQPESLISYENGVARLRNFQGRIFEYRDPA